MRNRYLKALREGRYCECGIWYGYTRAEWKRHLESPKHRRAMITRALALQGVPKRRKKAA